MRSIDCQQDTAKLVELAGIAVPDMRQVKCPMSDGEEIASDNTALGTLEATFYSVLPIDGRTDPVSSTHGQVRRTGLRRTGLG